MLLYTKAFCLDEHAQFSLQIIYCFSDLRPIGPPLILFYLACCIIVFVGLVVPKSYMNPDMTVHLQVTLCITDLMIFLLFDQYFWFALFHQPYLEAFLFLDDFDVLAIVAVLMYPVNFSMIYC